MAHCIAMGVVKTERDGPSIPPAPGSKPPYTQTAARVAAVLAKSAAATQPVPQQPRAQFYGHNPNLNCMYSYLIYELYSK